MSVQCTDNQYSVLVKLCICLLKVFSFCFGFSLFQLQVVHYNSKYSSYDEALQHPDGIAIFVFLFKVCLVVATFVLFITYNFDNFELNLNLATASNAAKCSLGAWHFYGWKWHCYCTPIYQIGGRILAVCVGLMTGVTWQCW